MKNEFNNIVEEYWDTFAHHLWDAIATELLFLGVDTSDLNEARHFKQITFPNRVQRWFWKGQEIVRVEPLEPPAIGYKILQFNCTKSVEAG